MLENYLRPLAAESFLSRQIATIDSVKPLAAADQQKLRNLFLNRTKVSDESYSQILLGALNRVSTDTAYYAALFNADITKKALELTSN